MVASPVLRLLRPKKPEENHSMFLLYPMFNLLQQLCVSAFFKTVYEFDCIIGLTN